MNIFGKTDIGKGRDTNQDSYYINRFSKTMGFGIVCDGMGGQSHGGTASKLVCNSLMEELTQGFIDMKINSQTVQDFLFRCVSKANNIVYGKAALSSNYAGMGTTLIAAVVLDNKVHAVHVGDSRLYLYRDRVFKQLTVDHSLVQELYDRQKITKEEMENHPQKNIITRVIGVSASVDVDYLEFDFLKGDILLLCTDGLTNMCSDHLIETVLVEEVGQTCPERLIKCANKAGGRDNITVVVIDNRIMD